MHKTTMKQQLIQLFPVLLLYIKIRCMYKKLSANNVYGEFVACKKYSAW